MEHPRHNLPFQVTNFIGRESEVEGIQQCLRTTRLLTICGTAGVGKTRLALETASSVFMRFPGGSWYVELSSITEPALVAQSVALVLGVSERPGDPLMATLADAIGAAVQLIILDTCEHLLGPAAELAQRLLAECPNLSILVTSREPLGIPGETVWQAKPLSLPEPGANQPLECLAQCEAVRLFVDRASGVLTGFALTVQNANPVAQICLQLDGIPLAIELAAAWLRTLTVEQIAVRLDDRFQLLVGGHRGALPRQQTLRAAINWSYDLLSADEQILFARLAVFAGAATLETVEAVCAGNGIDDQDVLYLMGRLVDASMVATEERDRQRRYRLLETLRMFSREQLVLGGAAEETQRRHAEHYLQLAEAAEPALWGPDLAICLERLEAEHDDLRAALRWSVGRGEAEIAQRLGASLCRFWQIHGHVSEGLHWLEGGLKWTGAVSTSTRARALDAAGQLARDRRDYDRATRFYAESLALWREIGDIQGTALALNNLGTVAQFAGDIERSTMLHEESLALFRQLGHRQGVAISLLTLGAMAQLRGEIDLAATRCRESLELFREFEDQHGVAAALNNLGNLASAQQDHAGAEICYRESLDLFRLLGDKLEVAASLRNLSSVALDLGKLTRATVICNESVALSAELSDSSGTAAGITLAARIAKSAGDLTRAAQLFGAADATRTGREQPPAASSPANASVHLTALQGQLGEQAFIEAWRAGCSMSLAEAVAFAIAPASPAPADLPVEDASPGALTRREQEVVALITQGFTNRQIAESLFIAERTADTHVEHILAKLVLRSRTQVAAWAVENGLASPGRS